MIFSTILCISGCRLYEHVYVEVGGEVQWNYFYRTDETNKNDYLQKNRENLKSWEFHETLFLACNKNLTHTDSRIRLYAKPLSLKKTNILAASRIRLYAKQLSWKNPDIFTVKKVLLVDRYGDIIYEKNNQQIPVTTLNSCIILDYTTTEEWFYVGNRLILYVEIEHLGETKLLPYTIDIYSHQQLPYL